MRSPEPIMKMDDTYKIRFTQTKSSIQVFSGFPQKLVPHAATRQPPGFTYFSLTLDKCPNGTVAEVTTGTSGIAFSSHYDLRSLENFL